MDRLTKDEFNNIYFQFKYLADLHINVQLKRESHTHEKGDKLQNIIIMNLWYEISTIGKWIQK